MEINDLELWRLDPDKYCIACHGNIVYTQNLLDVFRCMISCTELKTVILTMVMMAKLAKNLKITIARIYV